MRVSGLVVLVALWGCNAVAPLEKPAVELGPGGDAAVLEAGADGPLADAPAGDAAVDGPVPDAWPWFDGGGGACEALWVQPSPLLVSDAAKSPAASPSIAAVGNVFYVAYVEENEVYVRRIAPFEPVGTVTGNVVKVSTYAPADAGMSAGHINPWITTGPTKHLGVVWSEPTNHQACSRDLQFADLKDADGTLYVNPGCQLNTAIVHGYAPASIAYHQGVYAVVSKVEYTGFPCDEHSKGLSYHFAASSCAATSTAYNLALDTRRVVVGVVPTSPEPWRLLRIHGVDPYALYGNTSGTGTFGSGEVLLDSDVEVVRPALVASASGGQYVAYVKTNETTAKLGLVLRHEGTPAASAPLAPTGTAAGYTEPALAREASTDTTVVVFTRLGSGTETLIGRVTLDATSGIQVTDLNEVSGSAATMTAGDARVPVVAAGDHGFGVAWQEKDEIYFKWVGCVPNP